MQIPNTVKRLTADEWERRVGDQIRELRLRKNLTQGEIARQANLVRTTVARIERGEGGSIHSLVQIARALGQEAWLDGFAPTAPAVSPMEMLHQERRRATRRQRARGKTEKT
jgi:transcriptional regulator with XRE-family HTH domain